MKFSVIELSAGGMEILIFDEEGNKLFRDRNSFSVMSYVENGNLSERGIEKFAEAAAYCKEICIFHKADEIHTIAPRFRKIIKNFDEAADRVCESCGLKFATLSGKERAYYDYLAVRVAKDGDFAAVNSGGCGTQIIGITENMILACPTKLGSVGLSARFLSGVSPTQSEIKNMKVYINRKLRKSMFREKFSSVVLLGNVSQAIMQMCADYYKQKQSSDFSVSKKDLNTFFKYYLSNPNKVSLVLKYAPERLGTVTANILVLKCVLKYLEAKTVSFLQNAVIDGYANAVVTGEYYHTVTEEPLDQKEEVEQASIGNYEEKAMEPAEKTKENAEVPATPPQAPVKKPVKKSLKKGS